MSAINKLKSSKDLAEAFRQYNNMIYKYLFVRVRYNKTIAEDLTQDTFIKAWKNRTLFSKKISSLRNWLFIIARNLLVDFYRSKKRTEVHLSENHYAITFPETDDQLSYDSILQKIQELSPKEQELITLRYINEFSIKEIAETVQKTKNATKVALHRALTKLRTLVNENNK